MMQIGLRNAGVSKADDSNGVSIPSFGNDPWCMCIYAECERFNTTDKFGSIKKEVPPHNERKARNFEAKVISV